ncbi:hypothetical protein ACFX19_011430 [Malus domestica]
MDNSKENRTTNRWTGRPYSERYYGILEKRRTLPVWQHTDKILGALKLCKPAIVVGQAGIGKSTQIPQFLLESAFRDDQMMVACTQPRAAAVKALSRRAAEEMDVNIGEEVGYSTPFEDCSSSRTVLKYLTHDMLLREAMSDPLLSQYRAIIVDEIHETSLSRDLLLVLLKILVGKKLLGVRMDLALVLTSACAAEAEYVSSFLYGATAIINIPLSFHPVEIVYSEAPETDYIHTSEAAGDILVFLPKEDEIENVCCKINQAIAIASAQFQVSAPVKILPLYSETLGLAPSDQKQVFDQIPERKIVASTDIAETSLTVPGIVYVIDTGLVAHKVYSPQSPPVPVESLLVSPISRPSAALRSKFASAALTLRKIVITDLMLVDFVETPHPERMMEAVQILKRLGAMDDEYRWTKLGEIMSEFPLDPQLSKMLIVSPQLNCSNEILSICAMLSVPLSPFVQPRGEAQKSAALLRKARFIHVDGDHLTLLNVYRAYKENNEDPSWCELNFVNHAALKAADNIRQQLVSIMARCDLKLFSISTTSPDYSVNIKRAMLAGYSFQVAHLQCTSGSGSGHYLTGAMDKVHLHPSSCLGHKAEWVIFNGCCVVETKKFIRTVTQIPGEWLVAGVQNLAGSEVF